MRKNLELIFGIISMFIFFVFIWNDYSIPFLSTNETVKTQGRISSIKFIPADGGRGFIQKATYYYFIDNQMYYDTKKISKKYGKQYLGNRVLIQYSIKNPAKTEIIHFYSDFRQNNQEVYFSYFENGYHQIEFKNSFFYYSEFEDQEKLISSFKGEFLLKKDTLVCIPFNKKKAHKNLLIKYSQRNKKELLDMKTNLTYR